MKRSDKELDAIINSTFAEIRDEAPSGLESSNAADSVWKNLSSGQGTETLASVPEQIRGCADFQALIPAYLSGSLSQARMMLVEDHTHECVPCRKALKTAKLGATAAPRTPAAKARQESTVGFAKWRWAAAAAIIAAAALVSLIYGDRFFDTHGGFDAIVYAMNGSSYHVSEAAAVPLKEGEALKEGQRVRAGKDSDTVIKLTDGTTVEMKARSELFFTRDSDGTTIHLDRGNIIVEAAHQGDRHLYVATADCRVAVKGTIFSVDSGIKGSQVAVVRGQVQVDYAGQKHILNAGQQTSTNPDLKPVPVKYQVGWSRNQEKYAKLLADIQSINSEAATAAQPLRYSSDLLGLMPSGTVFYVALPNLGQTLQQSNKIIEQHLKQNPALADWYNGAGPFRRNEVVDKIAMFSQYIGSEIALSASMTGTGDPGDPLVVCDLTDPAGFRSAIQQQVNSGSTGDVTVDVIDDPTTATPTGTAGKTVYVWITGYKAAGSTSLPALQNLAAAINAGAANPFLATSFYSDLAATYQQGVSEIVGADLEQIMANLKTQDSGTPAGQGRIQAYTQLGLFNLKHFILVNKEASSPSSMAAVLTFNQSNHGIASWLAQPGPMGALDFVSPDANVVAAFAVKNTSAMVSDLLTAAASVDKSVPQNLDTFKAETGIDIRTDLAAPLGGEYAFALDGPVLPTPSWKLIVEVYDQNTLQQTLQKFVNALNLWAMKAGHPMNFNIQQSDVSGQTYYTVVSGTTELFSYTFSNAYMIVGPSRGILDQAIRYQQSGYTLVHSAQFQSALPADGNTNFSAFVYQNIGSAAGSFANSIAGGVASGHQKALKSLASVRPSLAYACAGGDRILFGATGEGGPFGLSPTNLLGIPNVFTLQGIINRSRP